MKWLESVVHALGGPERVRAMLQGRGVSFILKSIALTYRRPVTYPDTVRYPPPPCRRAPLTRARVGSC
jgi:acyl-CoA thioesterase FadM